MRAMPFAARSVHGCGFGCVSWPLGENSGLLSLELDNHGLKRCPSLQNSVSSVSVMSAAGFRCRSGLLQEQGRVQRLDAHPMGETFLASHPADPLVWSRQGSQVRPPPISCSLRTVSVPHAPAAQGARVRLVASEGKSPVPLRRRLAHSNDPLPWFTGRRQP